MFASALSPLSALPVDFSPRSVGLARGTFFPGQSAPLDQLSNQQSMVSPQEEFEQGLAPGCLLVGLMSNYGESGFLDPTSPAAFAPESANPNAFLGNSGPRRRSRPGFRLRRQPEGGPLDRFRGGSGSETGRVGAGRQPGQPLPGGTPTGRSLAQNAEAVARQMNTSGYCYRGVKRALRSVGVNLTGGSAYQAAGQLARDGRFREIQVDRDQLRNLPPGAVVVWDRTQGHPHGHISVALGDGREASDKLRKQITNYGPRYRVFVPRQ